MFEYERHYVRTLVSRLGERPEKLMVISGPRQAGKTTLVRQALRNSGLRHDYLPVEMTEHEESSFPYSDKTVQAIGPTDVRDRGWLVRNWEIARRKANESNQGFVLVFDEVQQIPQWTETVKGLWDADRAEGCPMHVVILCSAPLSMQQRLTESMAGRFETIRVSHWSFTEMARAFDFDLASYIYFGGYPGAADLVNDQPRWREYIRASLIGPVMERDILDMARVDRPALLRSAFELGSSFSGQEISYSKMVGRLQDAGNTTTIPHYLELLSQSGLLTGLPKYNGQQHRGRASSSKLNVLNTAFMSVNSGHSFDEAQANRSFWGRLAESAVGAHLCNTGRPEIKVYYWREGHHEVDFVLKRGPRLVRVEVRNGPGHGSSPGGLDRFQGEFDPARTLLVGGQGIPLEEFLSYPATDWCDVA